MRKPKQPKHLALIEKALLTASVAYWEGDQGASQSDINLAYAEAEKAERTLIRYVEKLRLKAGEV